MLRPSTAPRWKIAMRTFLRRAGEAPAYTARPNQAGAAPTPKIASAELFRNKRLDCIVDLNSAQSSSAALEFRRSQHQARQQRRSGLFRPFGLLLLERLLDGGARDRK